MGYLILLKLDPSEASITFVKSLATIAQYNIIEGPGALVYIAGDEYAVSVQDQPDGDYLLANEPRYVGYFERSIYGTQSGGNDGEV